MKSILQITAGVLLAGAIVFGLRLLFLAYFLGEVDELTQDMQARSQARINAQRVEQQQQRALADAAKQAEIDAAREREKAAALHAAQERARRQAFEHAYEIPTECEWPQSEKALIECANHKMAAKRAFYDSHPIPNAPSLP